MACSWTSWSTESLGARRLRHSARHLVTLLLQVSSVARHAIERIQVGQIPGRHLRWARLAGRWFKGRLPHLREATSGTLETAYCAEVVAVTYEDMGLLEKRRRANWYDPGKFWSGDDLELRHGASLGEEIAVSLPDG